MLSKYEYRYLIHIITKDLTPCGIFKVEVSHIEKYPSMFLRMIWFYIGKYLYLTVRKLMIQYSFVLPLKLMAVFVWMISDLTCYTLTKWALNRIMTKKRFRNISPLWGEFAGHRWNTGHQWNTELWDFVVINRTHSRVAADLKRQVTSL